MLSVPKRLLSALGVLAAHAGLSASLASPAVWAQTKVHTNTPSVTGRQIVLHPDASAIAPLKGGARSLYVLYCAGCHGMDASGTALGGVPDMRSVGHFLKVSGGREFLLKVPGVMGSGLDDAQVAAVTNWVLTNLAAGSVPAEHRPYEAVEVTRARTQPLRDLEKERLRLLELASRLRGAAPSCKGALAGC